MRTAAALLLIAALSGCVLIEAFRSKQTRAYLAGDIEKEKIRRVAVVPLINATCFPDAGRLVTETLTAEFKKLGKFEVVPLAESELPIVAQRNAVVEPRELTNREIDLVAQAAGVDAVVVGSVTQYMPYRPMVLGVHLKMIRPGGGKLLWSVNEIYDSSLHEVVNRCKTYSEKIESTGKLLEGWYDWHKPLVSMRFFTQFVCHEVVQSAVIIG